MTGVVRKAWSRVVGPRSGPVILMYHRIAEPAFDPWGLAVSPGKFEEQLAVLKRRHSLIGMDEFAEQHRRRRLPRNAAAVTFDDGYLDNLTFAKPQLEAAGVPATVFVTTGQIGCLGEFWWDELARIVLGSQAAVDVEIQIGSHLCRLSFRGVPEELPRPKWRAWDPPVAAREAAYLDLWQKLQGCLPKERQAAMSRLRALPSTPPDGHSRSMSRGEIRQLASASISLGAHGVSHQPLPSLALEAREQEIRESGQSCRSITAQSVEGFAYPHGAADNATRRLVAEVGYRWACSTESRSVRPGDDPYDLPRLQVGDWRGDELSAAITDLAA